jgi:hypothetical protein
LNDNSNRENLENEARKATKANSGSLVICEATGWQKHTVRGFVSISGQQVREEIECSKNAARRSQKRLGPNYRGGQPVEN